MDRTKETVVVTATPTSASDESSPHPQRQNSEKPSLVERWWIWEFSAWFICFAALIGMIGFLMPMDQKSVPNWVLSQSARGYNLGFSVSINSILSIFSTVVKSMILIPVAASIGQLKWLWFSDGHKLADFQRFEAARSGPLGSILLFWAMKGRSLVCLGALIVIGSLTLDFSFQQLVTYPPVPRQVGTAYMPATKSYSNYAASEPSGIAGLIYNQPDQKMQSALKIGMEGIDASIDVAPTCSTGNCTWANTVTTLAVCSECREATDSLIKDCATYDSGGEVVSYCNYSLPNSLTLPGIMDSLGYTTLFTSSGELTNTSFFEEIKSPVGILSTIGNTHGTQYPGDVYSMQCALSWCVKKYNVSVSQNNMVSKLVDTFHQPSAERDENGDLHLVAPTSFMADTGHNGSETFTVAWNTSSAFIYYFFTNSHFSSQIMQDPTMHTFGTGGFASYIWRLSNFQLTQAMSYLAGNMTNVIRMSNNAVIGSQNTNAAGVTLQHIPKVNVVWWWLFLPGTLLISSLSFLIMTVLASRKRGAMLWKTSALASFYHPLSQAGRERLRDAQGVKGLEKIAEEVQVKSELTEKGYRLIQEEHGR